MNGHTLNNRFVVSMNHLKVMVMDEMKRSRLCYHLHLAEAMMRNVEVQMMETDDGLLRDREHSSEAESELQGGIRKETGENICVSNKYLLWFVCVSNR